MSDIGGNVFSGVMFPVAFGDRYLAVGRDRLSGQMLVDVYHWDHDRNRLVVELFHGRPLPGAAPLTVTPYGGEGGIRLGVTGNTLVGYLSGGEDPRSVVVTPDRIEVLHGDTSVFQLLRSSIAGSAIGVALQQDGGVALGAALPTDFPPRRAFIGADIELTDVIRGSVPMIVRTDFLDCRVLGPAVIAAAGPVAMNHCVFPADSTYLWTLPTTEGVLHGVIGLAECDFVGCGFDNVGIALPPGQHHEFLAHVQPGDSPA